MADMIGLTERDILVRLDGKFDMMEGRVERLESAVDLLRKEGDEARGAQARGSIVNDALMKAPSIIWAILATASMVYIWVTR